MFLNKLKNIYILNKNLNKNNNLIFKNLTIINILLVIIFQPSYPN